MSNASSSQPEPTTPDVFNISLIACDELRAIVDVEGDNSLSSRYPAFYLVIRIVYYVWMGLGTWLNLLVIVAFVQSSKLRSVALNYCIVQLAVSDLMLCLINAPSTMFMYSTFFWTLGSTCCKAFNLFVSSFTLAVIALTRWLWLTSQKHVLSFLAAGLPAVWLLSIAMSAPYGLFLAGTQPPLSRNEHMQRTLTRRMQQCHIPMPMVCGEIGDKRLVNVFISSVFALQYLCPLLALTASYASIVRKMKQRMKLPILTSSLAQRRKLQRTKRSFLLQLSLISVYAGCWLPFNSYNMLLMLNVDLYDERLVVGFHNIALISAILNPVLYGMLNENFHRELSKWLPFLRRRANVVNKSIASTTHRLTHNSLRRLASNQSSALRPVRAVRSLLPIARSAHSPTSCCVPTDDDVSRPSPLLRRTRSSTELHSVTLSQQQQQQPSPATSALKQHGTVISQFVTRKISMPVRRKLTAVPPTPSLQKCARSMVAVNNRDQVPLDGLNIMVALVAPRNLRASICSMTVRADTTLASPDECPI